jgi:methanogenic corrinoid protein MtbC1
MGRGDGPSAPALGHLPSDPARLEADLYGALRDGRGRTVRTLVHEAFRAGFSPAALADGVIAPALARLGHDWQEGRIDVLHEHRGMLLLGGALYQLKEALEGRGQEGRPVAVGGAPEGDHYFLASLLAQLVMLDAGWDAINLGPNTPLASFRKALAELRPRLVWLSVSFLPDVPTFMEGFRRLSAEARAAGAKLVIGGQALPAAVADDLPGVEVGGGLTRLANLARQLHPPRGRPRRGRPPGRQSEPGVLKGGC